MAQDHPHDDVDVTELVRAPFNLDDDALAWVEQTARSLNDEEKLWQLMMPLLFEAPGWEAKARDIAESGAGGLYRFITDSSGFLARTAEIAWEHSAIPPLLCSDVEFDEVGAVAGTGTPFPNQLAVAASDVSDAARKMARTAVDESASYGYTWSFTPVCDVVTDHRNTLVTTRSFGSDVDRVRELTVQYVDEMEKGGSFASTLKHFPGDGTDERDMHMVPTRVHMTMEEWRSTFGQIFAAGIAAGARTVMPGHISFPAYGEELGLPPEEACLPATLSSPLLRGLLRGELGFGGVIVSDASEMGGLRALGARENIVPATIEAGCDILLFPLPGDHAHLVRALRDGRLSAARVESSVRRVLALKASLGLHRGRPVVTPPSLSNERAQWASDVSRGAVTLVQNRHGDVPLGPEIRRIGVLQPPSRPRRRGDGNLPELRVAELLGERGLDVTILDGRAGIPAEDLDALIYVVAGESRLGRLHRRLDWPRLHGAFPQFMARHFHDLPTVLISFGDPYHLNDVPTVGALINAYSPVPAVQEAAVAALLGEQPFRGASPVDPFAGLLPGEIVADTAVAGYRGHRRTLDRPTHQETRGTQ